MLTEVLILSAISSTTGVVGCIQRECERVERHLSALDRGDVEETAC